jgi:hypothetical protein
MSLVTYNITLSDFPNNDVHSGQLFAEIEKSGIANKLNKVYVNESTVDITFIGTLSDDDFITLNNLIKIHQIKTSMQMIEQPQHNMIGDNNIILTTNDLNQGIHICDPTANRTITLPDPETLILENDMSINTSQDLIVINRSTTNNIQILTDQILLGNDTIETEKSGMFRIRATNVDSGNESYIVYRIN